MRETGCEEPARHGIRRGRRVIFGCRGCYAHADCRMRRLTQAALARRRRTALLAAREGAFARRDR